MYLFRDDSSDTFIKIKGGSGGGAGCGGTRGNNVTNDRDGGSGAGGGGGGVVWISAKTIALAGVIEAKGGNGGNGGNVSAS